MLLVVKSRLKLVVALVVWCFSQAVPGAPGVVVTIAPVHSLISAVMQGVGSPELLFPATRTPHGAGLKPSQVRTLAEADLVVLVDSEFERSVMKVVKRNREGDEKNRVLTLSKISGIELLTGRNISLDTQHTDVNHAHDHPEEGELDPHLWLSIKNAEAIVSVVAGHLSSLDPSNAVTYLANARSLQSEFSVMRNTISARLHGLRSDWLFFHDAYQYFETEFKLAPVATVTVDPERQVSGKRLRQLMHLVETGELNCIYIEPQLRSNLVDRLVDQTDIKVLSVDPLGSELEPGPRLWFELMDNLAQQLAACDK